MRRAGGPETGGSNPLSPTMYCPYCKGAVTEGALRCQHCGEWLSEKARATEAKKAQRAVREERQDHQNRERITVIAIVDFLIFLLVKNNNNGDTSNTVSTPSSITTPLDPAKAKQDVVTTDAPVYCKNHSATAVLFKAGSESLAMGYSTSSGHGFSAKWCQSIPHDIQPTNEAMDAVAIGHYYIGMESMLLLYGLGDTDNINNTSATQVRTV